MDVLCNSWGSTLGVLAAQQHPDRFAAIVGAGQMVSQRETDVRMYEQMLADAAALDVPVWVVDGADEHPARADPAEKWTRCSTPRSPSTW